MGRVVALVPVAVLAWAGLGFVVVNFGPNELSGRLAFFILLYVALIATLGLVAYTLSFRLFASKAFRGNLGRALENGTLWATFVAGAVALQFFRMLSWVNGGLMIGLLLVAQFLLLARQHPKPQSQKRRSRR